MSKKGHKFPRGFTVKLACDEPMTSPNFEDDDDDKIQKLEFQHSTIKAYLGHSENDTEAFKEKVGTKKFFVIIFNVACYIECNNAYIPIEIGLVEYSIVNGVSRTYHKVIDFGSIPTGYYGAAKMHSEDTHDLLFAKVRKENQYSLILNEIVQFFNSGEEELPAVFTRHDQVEQTRGCLRWLYNKIGFDLEEFQVLDLAILHYELRLGVQECIPLLHSIDLFEESKYNFASQTRCAYHEETDSQYCALGIAKNQCYLMSNSVCQFFEVPLTDRHRPPAIPSSEISFVGYPRHKSGKSATSQQGVNVRRQKY